MPNTVITDKDPEGFRPNNSVITDKDPKGSRPNTVITDKHPESLTTQ